MPKIKIAIVGFGVVGRGTARNLIERKKEISARGGVEIEIAKICDLQIPAEIPFDLNREIFTKNVDEILQNDEIQIVVETVGGVDFAKNLIEKSLRAKKNVVSANKHLIAKFGDELFKIARENGVQFLCEAAVAGAIPCLNFLRRNFPTANFTRVSGILNGTANFILSHLQIKGGDFAEVLKTAQKLGYAEADPAFDIDGIDAAHKIAILANFAFGVKIDFSKVRISGISNLIRDDFEFAKSIGYKIKLVSTAEKIGDEIFVSTQPTLVKKFSALGQTDGVLNCALFDDEFSGPLYFQGHGAGGDATGTAIATNIIEIAENFTKNFTAKSTPFLENNENLKYGNFDEKEQKTVFRALVKNEVGVLAKIAQTFADEKISISGVYHDEKRSAEIAPILIFLEKTKLKNLKSAAEKIAKLSFTASPPIILSVDESEKSF